MASLHPLNFFSTTLRAPVLVSDTQLQLATGSTAPLNVIAAGDFVYMTVNDGTTVEVMKYVSSGSIVADTITVVRAQDNTTAKAFPSGACVAIGWNVLQIETLISEFITGDVLLPVNTQVITGSASVPSGTPPDNVIYTINTTTGQAWYWNGTTWIALTCNNLQLLAGVPSGAPAGGIFWTFNILTAQLYFWDGTSAWVLVTGNPPYLETYNRQYLDIDVGTFIDKGTDSLLSDLITAETIAVTPTYFKPPDIVPGIISITPANTIKFGLGALVTVTATVQALMDDTKDAKIRVALVHSGDLAEYVGEAFHPANTGVAIGASVSSGLVTIPANDEWDVNFVVVDGGGSYVGVTVTQFTMNVTVIAVT